MVPNQLNEIQLISVTVLLAEVPLSIKHVYMTQIMAIHVLENMNHSLNTTFWVKWAACHQELGCRMDMLGP